MSVPLRIQKSDLRLPEGEKPHKVVTWRDRIILWGYDCQIIESLPRNTTVFYHLRGEWVRQETIGDAVPNECKSFNTLVEVLDDRMFVIGETENFHIRIYCLDLNTWVWTSLTPSGASPNIVKYGMSS